MSQNVITDAVRQVLEYLHIYQRVAVRVGSPLRDGEEAKTIDFIVAEGTVIKAEATTTLSGAVRVGLYYEDELSCKMAWRQLRAFAAVCGRSGGGYYNFKHGLLSRPKKRKSKASSWAWVDIWLFLKKLRSETDVTGIVSRSLFGSLLSQIPGMNERSLDQRQRFKQHLVRSGLLEEISNGSCIAGYRLPRESESATAKPVRPSTLEDARVEAILKLLDRNALDSFLTAATLATSTDRLGMAAIVRLTRKHLTLPLELKNSRWYPTVIVKALLETGYFERIASARGHLQLSTLAYDAIEATRDQE